MMVFLLDENHNQRAKFHCDKHVNKMLVESTQLMNTALHINDAEQLTFDDPIRPFPEWAMWAAESFDNWLWLLDHSLALGEEFRWRSARHDHRSLTRIMDNWVDQYILTNEKRKIGKYFDGPPSGMTDFPVCVGDTEHSADPIETYRRFYNEQKVPHDWCEWSTETPYWVES